ncbi:DNA phosphorothioation-dependent restriction protein DptG [Neptuniibacter sp. SY11_33]|uniref:DNA phosphorothioation-dependent restriction protein DptG n=1 Tax=Neptuniibacter sp. SY11_33 TaxID=3398215 RepID=UPI0039F53C18
MLKTELEVPVNNSLSTFLPIIRTKDKHYKFCWDSVLGYFTRSAYARDLRSLNTDDFRDACKERFFSVLDDREFWSHIEGMYFKNDYIFEIAPELMALKSADKTIDANSKKLGDMLQNLLNGFCLDSSNESSLNFLDKIIKYEFDKISFEQKDESKSSTPYLPYLTDFFKRDLCFLNRNPRYFSEKIYDLLRLYGFLYVSQMALNIRSWKDMEPRSKPCFFIMDSEVASRERINVKSYGYSQLNEHLSYLFPYLAMNEALQKKGEVVPLWLLAECIRESEFDLNKLNDFANDFFEKRKNNYKETVTCESSESVTEALDKLLNLSYLQFDKAHGNLTTYNQTAVRGMLKAICGPFIQRRGQSGQVLTFNQDYIVLLTNLAIGERQQLRFHELIKEFELRGVFFDKQSQQALVEFYERMGNVERMSDSGDAVYVSKTI